jgi:hypothetical protein
MKVPLVILLAAILAGCQTPPGGSSAATPSGPAPRSGSGIRFAGGDGSSFAAAIVVHAPNNIAGVGAEYDYLKKRFPGHRFVSQALANRGGKVYDVMTIVTADGKKRVLHFDITQFFGRWSATPMNLTRRCG